VAKIRRKVKAIAYFFPFFARFSKMEKVAKIGRKVKATGLLFSCFLPLFQN
jgi:glycopeptide antibiotics resistance protein